MTGHAEAPLKGVRVIEFAHLIAGPSAAMALQELGADVVKIESDRGDRARALSRHGIFRAYNRGKKSVVLDLKSPGGNAAALDLLRDADVLIEGAVPGVMERLGLDYATVSAVNPRLIYVSVSAFNRNGPDRERGGLDAVIQAECGLMSITGMEDGPPLKVGCQVVDAATGLAIGQAVCAALYQRERNGRGQHVATSLFDVGVYLQAGQFADYFLSGEEPGRLGNNTGFGYPTDVFDTVDGYLQVTAYFEDRWQALCEILGAPEIAQDPRFRTNRDRLANRHALRPLLAELFRPRGRAELRAQMAARGIPTGHVRSYGEIEARLAGTDADPFSPADGEIPIRVVAQPYGRTLGVRHVAADAPKLGEHTAELVGDPASGEPS